MRKRCLTWTGWVLTNNFFIPGKVMHALLDLLPLSFCRLHCRARLFVRLRSAVCLFAVSFMFAVSINALVEIQEALEDPFDGGIDDVDLTQFSHPQYPQICVENMEQQRDTSRETADFT